MKKQFFMYNQVYITLLLLSMSILCKGMENNNQHMQAIEYKQQAEDAHFYNNNHWLSDDILKKIFRHSIIHDNDEIQSLAINGEKFMKFRKVCKRFNALLSFETIGKLCELSDKNKVLQKIVNSMNDFTYKKFRVPILILISAGGDANIKDNHNDHLLGQAIDKNDIELARILFQHNANPNLIHNIGSPLFFYCKTKEMAELFIDKKVNVHAQDDRGLNVLWHIIKKTDLSAQVTLIPFYLKHNVNAKLLDNDNNDCLLHAFADYYNYISIEKAKLILAAIPEIINHKNKNGQTPLDLAYKSLERAKNYNNISKIKKFEQLIELYIRTSQEVEKEKITARAKAQENTQHDCCICFDTKENMLGLPCAQVHPERICLECYNTLLSTSNKCPLCRKELQK